MKTETHVVNIGGIGVGGSNPIVIQSMTEFHKLKNCIMLVLR